MELWTVDTWRVKDGAEDDFVKRLRERGATRIFRDLNEPRTLWSPRRWDSMEDLEAWHAAFATDADDLVESVRTHVMELVDDER